jgi:hypothetical protein
LMVGGFWHVISWSWLQVQRLGEDEEWERRMTIRRNVSGERR